ncbi:hypothetical protein FQN54_000201 [Arachnomyces sp. PD_36]|nr:hypothetical protein FQN54_000201 [Arachnomyces sp. PD_36]
MSPSAPDEPFDREDAPFLPPVGSGNNNNNRHNHQHHRRDSDNTDIGINDGSNSKHAIPKSTAAEKVRFRLTVVLFVMVLALETGMIMSMGPLTRLYESIACRNYYSLSDPGKIGAGGQVKEELCKVNDVQTEVAAVVGYMQFFDGLLSALLAIPYGLLADRIGRKPTVCLSIPGFILNGILILVPLRFSNVFPLRTVWLSSLTWFIGGGPVVAFATLWTMMADVTTNEERASVFFKFGVAVFGAECIAGVISSWLMTLNPWIPTLLGFGIVILGMLFSLVLPETMPVSTPRSNRRSSVELADLVSDDDTLIEPQLQKEEQDSGDSIFLEEPGEESFPFIETKQSTKPTLFSPTHTYFRSYLTPYKFIFQNKRILLLLTAFLVYRLSRGSSWFLVQYVSTRYDWTIAQANLLLSFRPALSVPLFLYIIPYLSKYLLQSMKPAAKDLHLARISILLLTLGTLGIGLSPSISALIPSLILQSTGSGFVFLIRSLIATLVERREMARLFTVIEILQSGGNVIASLAITTVFQAGLEMGGRWVGLAWMMTSLLFGMVGGAIWVFRLPGERGRGRDRERGLRTGLGS